MDERLSAETKVQGLVTELNQAIRKIYHEAHTYRRATLSEFPLLDEKFYQRTTTELAQQGFNILGEVEDVTISQENPNFRTCIRIFSGDEGKISAAIYHVNTSGRKTRYFLGMEVPKRVVSESHIDQHTIDIETEFVNGHFLCTTNNPSAGDLATPDAVMMIVKPLASLKVLLKAHRRQLKKLIRDDMQLTPMIVQTYEDALKSQARLESLKGEYRRSVGILDEEIEEIAGEEYEEEAQILKQTNKQHSPTGTTANPAFVKHRRSKEFKANIKALLIFGSAGLLMTVLGGYPVLKNVQSLSWPDVEGSVIKAEMLQETRKDKSKTYPVYWPQITYQYTVDRGHYSSNEVYFHLSQDQFMKNYVKAEAQLHRYPAGTKVTVYYNPKDTRESVLDRSFRLRPSLVAVFGLFFLWIGTKGLFSRTRRE